ncbi:MAG: hypothetical protein Q8942_19760 [Bacillota bacterium]|nr:hypothetical protein [Bacillota bacterium]
MRILAYNPCINTNLPLQNNKNRPFQQNPSATCPSFQSKAEFVLTAALFIAAVSAVSWNISNRADKMSVALNDQCPQLDNFDMTQPMSKNDFNIINNAKKSCADLKAYSNGKPVNQPFYSMINSISIGLGRVKANK